MRSKCWKEKDVHIIEIFAINSNNSRKFTSEWTKCVNCIDFHGQQRKKHEAAASLLPDSVEDLSSLAPNTLTAEISRYIFQLFLNKFSSFIGHIKWFKPSGRHGFPTDMWWQQRQTGAEKCYERSKSVYPAELRTLFWVALSSPSRNVYW